MSRALSEIRADLEEQLAGVQLKLQALAVLEGADVDARPRAPAKRKKARVAAVKRRATSAPKQSAADGGGQPRTRSTHSEAKLERARAIAESEGLGKASARTGIPYGTLYAHAKRGGWVLAGATHKPNGQVSE